MQVAKIRMFITLTVFILVWSVSAPAQQDKIERETMIHRNVSLIALSPTNDLPGEIQKNYREFLPLFEEVLKENTSDESDTCALILRLTPGVREVGAKKTQRPQVQVNSSRKNSRQEYVATFILYSYINEGPVDREETTQFLNRQVLNVMECSE